MVFAGAEVNTVTDGFAARSSLREGEQEPQKIGKGQGTRAIEDSRPRYDGQ